MSRVQTPDFGTIGIQPVAQPTSQFYQPEVRQGLGASSDLIGLAKGLAAIEPALNDTANLLTNWQNQQNQEDLIRGRDDQATLGLKNQKALMAAVAAGKIKDSDNPWYMVGLKQSVASVEADQASADLFNQYTQDPIQHSDNPAEVESWIQQKLSPLTQGRDPFEMQVLAPRLQQISSRLMTYHVQQRSEERRVEASDTAAAELSATLDALPRDASPEQVSAVQSQIGAWANSKLGYMTKAQLNAVLTNTAKDYALSSENAGIFSQVLQSIPTTGGKTLADTAENRLTDQEIHAEITAKQAQDQRAAAALDKQQAEQTALGIMDHVNSMLVEARKTNPQAGFSDVGFTLNSVDQMEANKSITPLAADDLRQMLLTRQRQYEDREDRAQTVQDRAKKQGLNDLSASFIQTLQKTAASGATLTLNQMIPFAAKAAELGSMSDASDYFRTLYDFNRDTPRPVSDPDAVANLRSTWAAGKSLVPIIPDVWSKLSPEDQDKWGNRLHEEMTASATQKDARMVSGASFTAANNLLKDRILFGARLRGKFTDDKSFQESGDSYTNATDAVQAAQALFQARYESEAQDPSWASLTPQQRSDKIALLADDVGKAFLAPSREEYAKAVLSQTHQEAAKETAKPPAAPEKPSQFPELEQLSKVDPLFEAVNNPALQILGKAGVTPATLGDPSQLSQDSGVKSGEFYASDVSNSAPVDQYMAALFANSAPGLTVLGTWPRSPEDARDKAMRLRLALKANVMGTGVIKRFTSKLQELQARDASGQWFIYPDEKRNLYLQAEQIKQLADLTSSVGITVDEAKQMGPQAWMSLPMFASRDDLAKRINLVGKELGLNNPADRQRFAVAQLSIIRSVQNRARERFGLKPAEAYGE